MGITIQDRLQTVETEKKCKYEVLASKLTLENNRTTRTIPMDDMGWR